MIVPLPIGPAFLMSRNTVGPSTALTMPRKCSHRGLARNGTGSRCPLGPFWGLETTRNGCGGASGLRVPGTGFQGMTRDVAEPCFGTTAGQNRGQIYFHTLLSMTPPQASIKQGGRDLRGLFLRSSLPLLPQPPPPPLCDIPSGCCFFTGPWTVTVSSLRMLRRGLLLSVGRCDRCSCWCPPPSSLLSKGAGWIGK